MSTNSQIAWTPEGQTVVIAANNPASTGIQVLVPQKFRGSATGQFRVINIGNVVVWLGFGVTAAEATAAAAAATAGNPSSAIPLVAGAVEILRFAPDLFFSGFASTASTVYMTPGQGL